MTRFLAGSTAGIFPNAARRLVVRGNTIAGSQQALFRIAGGGDGYVNCARAEHQITGNEIVGLATEEEQVLFYYRCATHSTITDNVMRQEAPKGSGMLFRDEADHNLVGNNLVWVRETSRGVLRIESGNADKHHPRENLFRGNQFSTELGRALYLQAHEAKLNTFVQNLFASNGERMEGGLRAGNYVCGRENLFDHNTFHEGTGISLIIVDPRTWGPTTFKNNVFDHGGDGFLVDFRGSAELWLGNHNVYFNRGGAADFAEAGREMSFEEWLEQSGEEESSIEGDPAYCDPARGDYTLRTRSVAAEADETGDEAGSFPTSDHVCPDPTPPSTPEAPVPTPSPVVCAPPLSACSGPAPPGTALPNDACCSGCCFVTVRSTAGFCVDESSCR
jgi:hypothetical protein